MKNANPPKYAWCFNVLLIEEQTNLLLQSNPLTKNAYFWKLSLWQDEKGEDSADSAAEEAETSDEEEELLRHRPGFKKKL